MKSSLLERTGVKPHSKEALKRRTEFIEGFKSGVPIAVGYIPIAVAFGLLAKSSGVPDYISIMMSAFVFAGASQFVGVNLMAMGAAPSEVIMTTLLLNIRHFLMAASISLKMDKDTPKGWRALLSYGITDETFSVASLNDNDRLHPCYLLGLNIIAYVSWNIGTWIGLFMAAGLPQSLQNSMGIALYAMFIGLLTPALKKSRPILIIAASAAGVHYLLQYIPEPFRLSSGWNIIIATVLAAALGAALFREGVE